MSPSSAISPLPSSGAARHRWQRACSCSSRASCCCGRPALPLPRNCCATRCRWSPTRCRWRRRRQTDVVRNASRYFGTLVDAARERRACAATSSAPANACCASSSSSRRTPSARLLRCRSARADEVHRRRHPLQRAPDPFARKVILDRGTQQVSRPAGGDDANGVIGQVTRVHPVQSEVTLLTDRDQAIPVSVVRSGVRACCSASARHAGDAPCRRQGRYPAWRPPRHLGLDGIFVPGLPVATVVRSTRPGRLRAHRVRAAGGDRAQRAGAGDRARRVSDVASAAARTRGRKLNHAPHQPFQPHPAAGQAVVRLT